MDYKTEIFKNYFQRGGNSDYLKVHQGNQESYDDIFSGILPKNKDALILEIGCGAGQLLYYIKTQGYQHVEGVDIGDDQVSITQSLGIKGTVITSIPQFLSQKKGAYDCIIMNQVIEHFSKDELWKNMYAIRDALKNGGLFIFVTPNMACFSGVFQRYIDITHETGFTERSASQLMRIMGFNNVEIKGSSIKLKCRPKRIAWWLLNAIWMKVMGFIYFVERGMDRPKILSRHLVVLGVK